MPNKIHNINNKKLLFTTDIKCRALLRLSSLFPDVVFFENRTASVSNSFSRFSKSIKEIYICTKGISSKKVITVALHEIGHCYRKNNDYILSEQGAWLYAQTAAVKHSLPFDAKFMVRCIVKCLNLRSAFCSIVSKEFGNESLSKFSVTKTEKLITSAIKLCNDNWFKNVKK